MNLYSRILGLPFVYKHLVPFILGFDPKKDGKATYDLLDVESNDIVVDIGCGMGNALEYLHTFSEYHGFDTDNVALSEFSKSYSDARVSLYNRRFEGEDAVNINPHKVLMIGLLHHIDDAEAGTLFENVSRSRFLKRIVTCDCFFTKNKKWSISNLLTKLDRGEFGREIEHYKQLVTYPLSITKEIIFPLGYFYQVLVMVIDVKAGSETP